MECCNPWRISSRGLSLPHNILPGRCPLAALPTTPNNTPIHRYTRTESDPLQPCHHGTKNPASSETSTTRTYQPLGQHLPSHTANLSRRNARFMHKQADKARGRAGGFVNITLGLQQLSRGEGRVGGSVVHAMPDLPAWFHRALGVWPGARKRVNAATL